MHTTQRGVCSLNSESATHWHEQATLVTPSDPNLSLPDVIYSDSTFTSCERSSGRSMGNQCVQQAQVQLHAEHFCERKPGTTSLGGLGTFDDGVNENDQPENMHFQKLINTPRAPASHVTADMECASGDCDSRSAHLTASREDNAVPSPRKLSSNVMNTTVPQILGNGGPTQVCPHRYFSLIASELSRNQININHGSGSFNTVGKNQGNVWAELFARSSSFGEATTNVPISPILLKDASSWKHNGSCGSGNNGPNHSHEPRRVQGPLFSTHHVDLIIVLVFVLFLVLAFLEFIAKLLVDASFGC